MKNKITPLLLFTLPDWARWHAFVELDTNFKIQVASLKFPRWDASFYPVYLDQNNKPLLNFPESLTRAEKEGIIWYSCPLKLTYSSQSKQIIIDNYIESDHPRPAISERQIISLTDFKAKMTEHIVGDFKNNNGALQRLPELSKDFVEKPVILY